MKGHGRRSGAPRRAGKTVSGSTGAAPRLPLASLTTSTRQFLNIKAVNGCRQGNSPALGEDQPLPGGLRWNGEERGGPGRSPPDGAPGSCRNLGHPARSCGAKIPSPRSHTAWGSCAYRGERIMPDPEKDEHLEGVPAYRGRIEGRTVLTIAHQEARTAGPRAPWRSSGDPHLPQKMRMAPCRIPSLSCSRQARGSCHADQRHAVRGR
jgi:hypothetical protein